jgi:hypothetical protein
MDQKSNFYPTPERCTLADAYHKIAISNHRIQSIGNETVTFDYKDYKQKGAKKQMTLTHREFIRRFALHLFPKRFVKIRHYGFLSSTPNNYITGQAWKRHKLQNLQQSLGIEFKVEQKKKTALPKCPCCKIGNLHTLLVFDKRGPPKNFLGVRQHSVSCSAKKTMKSGFKIKRIPQTSINK